MPQPPPSTLKVDGPQDNLLVVEGADDFHALFNLFKAYNIFNENNRRQRLRLEPGGGYEAICESIDTRILESGLLRIGFMVDADDEINNRWTSLSNVLITCGYQQVPEVPEPQGTILRQDNMVTLGLWLMPDNRLPGALEEFIRFLIPDNDLLWNHALASVDTLPTKPEPLTENWISKANIHTWLAWQEEPGKPIGQAITKRYLDPKAQSAQIFIAWVKELFALD